MRQAEFSRKQIRVLIRRGFSAVSGQAAEAIRSVGLSILPVLALLSILSAGIASAGPVGAFRFKPLAESSPCVAGGPDFSQVPLTLPAGFNHTVLATEGSNFPDQADMHTLNETGAHAGRFLYHTHEVRDSGAVSVTDLLEGSTTLLEQQSHWERLDGIDWTPWGTVLFAEEVRASRTPRRLDPDAPHALGGLVYEADPSDPSGAVVRPAIGSRAHEGLSFDGAGNLYGISEVGVGQGGGGIFKFVPDRRGDLSSGQLYALKVAAGTTGDAQWVALDRHQSEVDSDAEAIRKGATRFAKAEDLEVWAETLFVAISDDHRVIAIDLREQKTNEHGNETTFVWDYVKAGV
ncbi:MAG: alkaline phosphatase PhoX, partial [Actinomycetota bacterium]